MVSDVSDVNFIWMHFIFDEGFFSVFAQWFNSLSKNEMKL